MDTDREIHLGKADQTVSLSLFGFDRPAGRLWAFTQMLLARRPLSRLEGLTFCKLCGTGTGEGFTPVPNTSVYAILIVWATRKAAERQLAEAPVFARYRRHADRDCTLLLTPSTARGKWARVAPFDPAPGQATGQATGPIAALTRATIHPLALRPFWTRVGPISDVIGRNDDVLFKIGMGEVPWVHQVTFSVWPDPASMARFARADGPHARAIRAVRDGNWFREELYARFRILGRIGDWPGLTALPEANARS